MIWLVKRYSSCLILYSLKNISAKIEKKAVYEANTGILADGVLGSIYQDVSSV